MGCLHKNIQLMLEFLKGLFILKHFSYYTLMIFLMMLPVILLYAENTSLCFKGDLWQHLICGNNLNWLLNLNLIYETLDWGRKWLVDCDSRKTELVSFSWSNTGANDVTKDGSVKMLGLTFSSKLD